MKTQRILDRRWWMAVALVAVLAPLRASGAGAQQLWPPWMRDLGKEPVYPELTVSADSLARILDSPGLMLLDTRSAEAYRGGHIRSAVRIQLDLLDYQSDLGAALADHGVSAETWIICYGDRSSLLKTARLVWLLHLAGATRVQLLDGGIEAWRQQRHPVTAESVNPAPATCDASRDSSRIADPRFILDHFGRRGWEIIDSRGRGFGETAAALDTPGSVWRTGHIPHSMPVDFRAVIANDGTFLGPAEIRAYIAKTGPRPSTPVNLWAEYIVYDDGLSGEGALGYVVLLMAGIEKVRYFPGGWREWSAGAIYPITRITEAEELARHLAGAGAVPDTTMPLENLILIDVRHDPDYYAGHLPAAVLLPSHRFQDSFEDVLAEHWPRANRSTIPVVIYCYDSACIRSRNCSTYAARAGFLHVEWFRGGVEEWRNSGRSLVPTEPPWE